MATECGKLVNPTPRIDNKQQRPMNDKNGARDHRWAARRPDYLRLENSVSFVQNKSLAT